MYTIYIYTAYVIHRQTRLHAGVRHRRSTTVQLQCHCSVGLGHGWAPGAVAFIRHHKKICMLKYNTT